MATVVSGGAAGSLASAEITKDAMRRAKRDDVPSPWWPRVSVEYAGSVWRAARCDSSLASEALAHHGPHRRVTTSRAVGRASVLRHRAGFVAVHWGSTRAKDGDGDGQKGHRLPAR